MSLLVVMAHFDVDMKLRTHVRMAMKNYLEYADKLVVVSTSGLTEIDMEKLPPGVEFHARRNYGYDFFSYKWGLDLVGDYQDYDRVLVVNDSFVGPIVPIRDILQDSSVIESDFSGLTLSNRHGQHIQSFFFTFSSAVGKSNGMRNFWKDLVPISDRFKVISNYEVGLSLRVKDSGFKMDSYFKPNSTEIELAKGRWKWHLNNRLSLAHPGKSILDLNPNRTNVPDWNPAVAFADRILDARRLPILKIDTLRFDPYALGSSELLASCEDLYPEEFRDVRGFLTETQERYPFRPGEENRVRSKSDLAQAGLGYMEVANESPLPSNMNSDR